MNKTSDQPLLLHPHPGGQLQEGNDDEDRNKIFEDVSQTAAFEEQAIESFQAPVERRDAHDALERDRHGKGRNQQSTDSGKQYNADGANAVALLLCAGKGTNADGKAGGAPPAKKDHQQQACFVGRNVQRGKTDDRKQPAANAEDYQGLQHRNEDIGDLLGGDGHG